MERGYTERKTGGFEREFSRSKGSSFKKKKRPVVATEVIDLLIALMCHIFLFFFEESLQADTQTERKGDMVGFS